MLFVGFKSCLWGSKVVCGGSKVCSARNTVRKSAMGSYCSTTAETKNFVRKGTALHVIPSNRKKILKCKSSQRLRIFIVFISHSSHHTSHQSFEYQYYVWRSTDLNLLGETGDLQRCQNYWNSDISLCDVRRKWLHGRTDQTIMSQL
jgi:hypothetical protein